MAARKLQGEIERTLKKINEGIVEFEGVLSKVRTASTSNQKEKHEADLKRDIKKLQRLREQVKGWISGNEVKNKAPLIDARKRIETQMETFKAYEREAKTKAYSKEGLQRQREKELKGEEGRRDISEWLQDRIEELKRQIEQLESDIENQDTTRPKKKGSSIVSTENSNLEKLERHNFHLDSLEKMLRMWDNVALDRETVENIRDSIDYYVDNNNDDDFMEDDTIYDDLGLDDFDPGIEHDYPEYTLDEDGNIIDDDVDDDDYHHDTDDDHQHSEDETLEDNPNQDDEFEAEKQDKPQTSNPAKPTQKDVQSTQNAPSESAKTAISRNQDSTATGKDVSTTPATKQPAAAIVLDPTPAEAARARIPIAEINSPQIVHPVSSMQPQVGGNAQQPGLVSSQGLPHPHQVIGNQPHAIVSPVISHQQNLPSANPSISTPANMPIMNVAPINPGMPLMDASLSSRNVLPTMQPNLQASTNLQQPGLQAVPSNASANIATPSIRIPDVELIEMTALKASCRYMPEPEPTRMPYKPRTPAATPPYYPSTPAANLLDDPATFSKFPPDTLFFLFYFQQNTYQQYLAAKELKRQSWRYHTKYLTWFQRHEDPKTINPEYEQGTYVYFDYETGWCQRKKSEFTFQYVFLEDTELP